MQKEKVNINLALSKDLLKKLQDEADNKELTTTALIRLILQAYFENKENEKMIQ